MSANPCIYIFFQIRNILRGEAGQEQTKLKKEKKSRNLVLLGKGTEDANGVYRFT